jgi:alpha-beta hydrolase superfamily lysophospholipase
MALLHSEGFLSSYDGAKLYFQSWEKSTENLLLITHGHGEHSGSYHRVVECLSSLPVSVIAWDLRGHGRSDGQRGYAKEFSEYSRDLEYFIYLLNQKKIAKFKKLFLFAHSMGGLIQMQCLSGADFGIAGQILSSPCFGIKLPVPFIKELASAVAETYFAKLTLPTDIDYDTLSRIPEVKKEYETDLLRHQKMSAGVFSGMKKAFLAVEAQLSRLKTPTLIQIPQEDPVVDSQKTQSLVQQVKNPLILLRTYQNRRHELYNDLESAEVGADLTEFLRPHM